ncbi:hypothetical protein CCHR01_19914 [Colletotrichum chrysophilum]|uniref:Uncharacterized protein n=1 Tax=Colletotrichum chrysophilum TaxID=1836956 RepID=A0AAD9E4Q9_9PEZI|nr:hypothetical protein CCHR01_19914 [Colletotrichum chrysophilum]
MLVGRAAMSTQQSPASSIWLVMWSSAPNDHSPADAVNVPLCNGQTHRTRSDAPRFHNNPLNVQDITPDCARSNTLTTFDGLTCEDRRIELCRTFHERRFDAMIYSQPDALPPPHGILINASPTSVSAARAAKKTCRPFHLRLDPRIHWSHDHSDECFEQKMEEIKARGGRKANFGKATRRMKVRRIAAEQREAEEAAERVPAEGQNRAQLARSKPPEPWSHHRSMDFGDVPPHELPSYVQKNASWMRATEWMRKSRDICMQAAKLEAEHKP